MPEEKLDSAVIRPEEPSTTNPESIESTVRAASSTARNPATGQSTGMHQSDSSGTPVPLYVGIDLGTSRSSVCASNGRRATLPTVVGWPIDPIARGFLKKDIVFGEEAIANRLSIETVRPVEDGVIKVKATQKPGGRMEADDRTKEAASEFISHLIDLCEPLPDQQILAAIGTPGQVSPSHKDALLEAARESIHQVHITTEPFAVAFSLSGLHHVLVVDIGAGTTDLCRVHGSLPDSDDYLTLEQAGDFIDFCLYELMEKNNKGAQFSRQQVTEMKEQFSGVAPGEPIEVILPVNGVPTKHDITNDMKQSCSSIIEPIASAIRKLVGSYDPEFQSELKTQIWLSGGGSLINGLPKAIENAIAPLGAGTSVRRVPDPVFAGADGALKLVQTMPADYRKVLS